MGAKQKNFVEVNALFSGLRREKSDFLGSFDPF